MRLCDRRAGRPFGAADAPPLGPPRSLTVRLAQTEEAAKRAALASYGGQRAPPGAAKLYEAEQVRPSLFGVARCAVPARAAASRAATPPQRIAELSATVADLRRKLAKEREACAAAQRETKARWLSRVTSVVPL